MFIEKDKKHKKTFSFFILIFCLFLCIIIGFFWYIFLGNFTGGYSSDSSREKAIVTADVPQEEVLKQSTRVGITDLLRILRTPRTSLVLFLNNTEIRPGGGFIGSYAVLDTEGVNVVVHKLQGTESLDNYAPKNWRVEPPPMIGRYLGLDRWYFRDSNWSPDFQVSAKRSLDFYRGEKGVLGDKITTVVGVTPKALEEVLRIVGPITVQGIEFEADTVVETLEYEVEYGYEERGISFANRKQIMKPFFDALQKKVKNNLFSNIIRYRDLVERLVREKHMLVFVEGDEDDALRSFAKKIGAGGEVYRGAGDSVMWVDANLAALKTDHVMERSLSYVIRPDTSGLGLVAEVTMHYTHPGLVDWRTSRYKTYARVFVPEGAELIESFVSYRGERLVVEDVEIEEHQEMNKVAFGSFIIVEPGSEKDLTFRYYLPPDVVERVRNDGVYSLVTQKQIGLDGVSINLDLDFGKPVKDGKKTIDVYTTQSILEHDSKISLTLE